MALTSSITELISLISIGIKASKAFTVPGRTKAEAQADRVRGFDRPRSPLGSNVSIGCLLLTKPTRDCADRRLGSKDWGESELNPCMHRDASPSPGRVPRPYPHDTRRPEDRRLGLPQDLSDLKE